MDKDFGWNWIIAGIIFGIALGFGLGIMASQMDNQNSNYKDASIMTCAYANNLTDIINLQSTSLHLCTGFDYTHLDKLNCSLLNPNNDLP